MANTNVTKRRGKKRKSDTDSDESADESSGPSVNNDIELDPAVRKLERQKREAKNNVLLDRARRQAESRIAQQNKTKDTQLGIVAQLLLAQKESKLLLANCFEQRTVLDIIDQSCVDRETISDMAVAIDAASTVYAYRVDRTHLDAQETSYNFMKNILDNSPVKRKENEEAVEPNSPVKNKLKDNGPNMHSRIDQLVNNAGDLNEEENEDEEEAEQVAEEVEVRPSALIGNANTVEELKEILCKLRDERVEEALRIKWKNRILEEDDEKISMTISQTSENDYYQQAISRHGDQNANSLLLNNTRCQGDGRLLHMHVRAKPDLIPCPTQLEDFARGVHGNILNALSTTFVPPENQFLPVADSLEKSMLNSLMENSECEDLEDIMSETTDCDLIDLTSMPDRTIMETTMAPNQTILMNEKRKQTKVYKTRGRNLNELWMNTDADIPNAKEIELEPMERKAHPKTEDLPKKSNLLSWPEMEMDSDEVRTEIQCFESSGFDGDFRDIENAYHSILVSKNVSQADADFATKEIDGQGGTKEEIYSKKRKLLLPGQYIFFMDRDEKPSNIPADPWVEEEGNIAANFETLNDSVSMDELDSFEADCAEDNNMTIAEDDNTLVDELDITLVRGPDAQDSMHDEPESDKPSDIQSETVESAGGAGTEADAETEDDPDASEDVNHVDSTLLLRHLGKKDAAHWKMNEKPTEKERKTRREKVQPEQTFENYFVLASTTDRDEAMNRFAISKINATCKNSDTVFLSKRFLERRPYIGSFDVEIFSKPGLLFEGQYGGVRFQRSIPKIARLSCAEEDILPESLEVEEAQDVEDICKEWLTMFGAFREVYNDDADDASVNGNAENDDVDIPAFDDDNDNHQFEEEIRVDSAASENTNKGPSPRAANQDEHERLRDLWAMQYDDDSADSDEDESETVTIMEKKVTITNSNIDQSRVKAYMREILMCPWMSADKLEKKSHDDSVDGDTTLTESSFLADDKDASEIVKAVFAPPHDGLHQDILKKIGTSLGNDGEEPLTSGVVLSDFNVEGLHSMSSLAAILPNRVVKKAERNMHVAFAFSIALQMCNENMLHLSQTRPAGERTGHTESWMGDFIVRNGTPPPGMGRE